MTQAPKISAPPPPDTAPRRTAFAEGVDRLRAAAVTEPGRLRIIGAVLAVLVVAFGTVTAWQMNERAAAADDVLTRSQPLSSAAADIYRSLAEANTAASSGFLAGGQETQDSRTRYDNGIRTAADGLVTAAANSEPKSPAAATIAKLNRLLPEYKGLVERARTYNRQGFPVGGAYLRYANEKMQKEMLPAAEDLYKKENQRLGADYGDAKPYPWAAIALGVVLLATLAWAQHRNYRRTNRVLNHGLVAATAASAVVLLWLVVGHSVARSNLTDSYEHGVRSLQRAERGPHRLPQGEGQREPDPGLPRRGDDQGGRHDVRLLRPGLRHEHGRPRHGAGRGRAPRRRHGGRSRSTRRTASRRSGGSATPRPVTPRTSALRTGPGQTRPGGRVVQPRGPGAS
ncbi:hypothetical protein STENM327S_02318 [Streptomyces tendae]